MNNHKPISRCPFDGHNAVLRKKYEKSRFYFTMTYYYVECLHCAAIRSYCNTPDEAISEWNERFNQSLSTNLLSDC
jgi:hypothetical protein